MAEFGRQSLDTRLAECRLAMDTNLVHGQLYVVEKVSRKQNVEIPAAEANLAEIYNRQSYLCSYKYFRNILMKYRKLPPKKSKEISRD